MARGAYRAGRPGRAVGDSSDTWAATAARDLPAVPVRRSPFDPAVAADAADRTFAVMIPARRRWRAAPADARAVGSAGDLVLFLRQRLPVTSLHSPATPHRSAAGASCSPGPNRQR